MYTLEIDTTGNPCRIALKKADLLIFKKEWRPKQNEARTVHKILAGLINKYPDLRTKISKVEVNRGPGSFTGTRIGVAAANAIAFLIGAKQVAPVYNKKPHITKPKKKHLNF